MPTGTWPLDWATGDIVTASEYRKSMGCVADSTLGASAASFDFTGLPTTYAHLMVVAYLRSDDAGTSQPGSLRFNGDATGTYDYQQITGNAATSAAAELFAQTGCRLPNVPGAGAGANLFNTVTVFIPNYAGTANNKIAFAMGGVKFGTASGNMNIVLATNAWRSSAAINRITVLSAAGNLVAGSRCSIYVMGS